MMWFSSVELKILNRNVGYPLVNKEFGEYPPVHIQKAMETHNFYGIFPRFLWSFPIVKLHQKFLGSSHGPTSWGQRSPLRRGIRELSRLLRDWSFSSVGRPKIAPVGDTW